MKFHVKITPVRWCNAPEMPTNWIVYQLYWKGEWITLNNLSEVEYYCLHDHAMPKVAGCFYAGVGLDYR